MESFIEGVAAPTHREQMAKRQRRPQTIMLGALLLTFTARPLRAQDPLKVLPNNYRLVWQNDVVRVIHVTYGPLEKLPVHNHSAKPTVYVYLSDSGPVRFSHIEEPPFSLVRPPEKAGTFRFSPGRLEKHEVENLGQIQSEFLRVELIQLPLGYQKNSFRSPKSFDAVHSGVRTEFDTPFVKIQRVVASPGEPTEVQAIDAGSLLIAFSPTSVQSPADRGKPQTLRCGDVLWIEARRAVQVSSDAQSAAGHLLRIVLERKR
jgi:hypothetical protein